MVANVFSNSEKIVRSGRVLLHKVNLSLHLQRRIAGAKKNQLGFLEINCRRSMLEEFYPGWEKLSRKQRNPLYAKFERYIKQGDVLLMIASFHAGLLFPVAPFMSRDEYVLYLQIVAKGLFGRSVMQLELREGQGHVHLSLGLEFSVGCLRDLLGTSS